MIGMIQSEGVTLVHGRQDYPLPAWRGIIHVGPMLPGGRFKWLSLLAATMAVLKMRNSRLTPACCGTRVLISANYLARPSLPLDGAGCTFGILGRRPRLSPTN